MAITPIKLSYEEFFQLPESNLPHELIDGELRMPAAPNLRHQRIVGHIFVPVNEHVEDHDLGIVIQAPADVVLDRDRPLVVQPDLLYITKDRAGIAQDKVFGAPDLTVEVSSGRGAIFDRTEKATIYAQYVVREYWHADPRTGDSRSAPPGKRWVRTCGRLHTRRHASLHSPPRFAPSH